MQRHVQISRVRNIDSVFDLTGVAFRLVPPYGGLRVSFDASAPMQIERRSRALEADRSSSANRGLDARQIRLHATRQRVFQRLFSLGDQRLTK